jgi:hypothetical protein
VLRKNGLITVGEAMGESGELAAHAAELIILREIAHGVTLATVQAGGLPV